MILVMATKTNIKVMYVFVRLKVSFTENVFTASPPPRIATSSKPYHAGISAKVTGRVTE